MRKFSRWAFGLAAICGLVWAVLQLGIVDPTAWRWGATQAHFTTANDPSAMYRLGVVERRAMVERVSATGTLTPVALVSVSSQVSGQIQKIYADFNDEVRAGQPIAAIDPITFQIAVEQAEADLDIALAGIETQKAQIDRMHADLETVRYDQAAAHANTEYAEVRVKDAAAELDLKIALGGNAAKSDMERAHSALLATQAQLNSARATEDSRASNVKSAEAQLRSSEAQLLNLEAAARQRGAALRQARLELERTVIRAPVDGIVTIRNIEVGSTVAVSLQAPTLFTIAQNLREMQVNASVTEAEIGRIHLGQRFDFSIDAYPSRVFTGEIIQIRMHPQTTQNVVNYTVVASAPNPDLALMPGMTATANIIIDEPGPVLAVTTTALRFRPSGEPRAGGNRIYILDGDAVKAVPVELGTSDNGYTAIRGEGIDEFTRVVLGLKDQGQSPLPHARGGFLGLF